MVTATPASPPTPPASAPTEERSYPLSFSQQRLWFLHRLDPESAAYNVSMALRAKADLDPVLIGRAVSALVERHDALRTTFRERSGEPVQVVGPASPEVYDSADLRDLPAGERERALAALAAASADAPFDLERGPLLRFSAVRIGEREWALLVAIHHIVTDGWSVGILLRELSALYADLAAGRPSTLPPVTVQYPEFAVWQREWLQGEVLEREAEHWRERLAGAPRLLDLPTDRPRPAVAGLAGDRRRFSIPPATVGQLRALTRSERATLFMVLFAGWNLLLARYAGEDDVLVGTPIAGRTRREHESTLGFFVNTLVIRSRFPEGLTFRTLVRQLRETTLDAFTHQHVPLEKLVEELGVERSLAHAPLFQVLFAFQNTERMELALAGASFESFSVPVRTAKFDLDLSAWEAGSGVTGVLGYRTDLFEGATIERLLRHYVALLGAVAADPDRPLERIGFLSPDERRRVVDGWNPVPVPVPPVSAHALFAAQAARSPAAAAIRFRGETVAYAALETRANRIAHHLRGLGVRPEVCVGVFLERTPELIAALFGVLKAGGAYVPLDPAYPRERLGYMTADAGVRLALTTGALAPRLPEGVRAVLLDAPEDALDALPGTAPEVEVDPENLSHVIFTSGSTGRPKGVMIRHGATTTLLHWLRETVPDEERAVALGATSVNFDVSVAEIFGTLCWGGTLVLVENALELPAVAEREGVRSASMVPTAAAELLRGGGIPPGVRTLNLGGEPLPDDLAAALHAAGTVETVRNLYGPTEDTTYSTAAVVPPGGGRVRLGRPIRNTRAYVLDRTLRAVPPGVVGELYLAGDGVARGYAGHPAATAESFLPDPLGPSGGRMYRVRDRVRWTADGALEYYGRTDFQVKVRGFRIELGEIEAALRTHPAVGDAVATVREDHPGDRRLAAYVVPTEGRSAPPAAELRRLAVERLPEYMVPSAFVALEALPRTPNGKVDRRALPVPEVTGAVEVIPARTPEESLVAAIFTEVLRVDGVGAHADFFGLGGHSLLAARVAARVREALGVELPLRALFEAPTVEALAARIAELRGAGAESEGPALVRVERSGGLPLSFAQQRLWFIHQVEPESAAYNMPFALRMRGALDPRALERSLEDVLRRHEALRTRFPALGGAPTQVVDPPAPVHLPVADLSARPAAEREGALLERVAVEAERPFDLARGPVIRALLVRLAEDDHALLLTMHHIVSDGWSMGVLTRELSHLYDAHAAGRAPSLPELPIQYADYSVWQRRWLTPEVVERQLAYWRERLAGAPPLLALPTDRPRPAWAGEEGGRCGFHLSPEATEALGALARREGATLFMALLAGFQALLARCSGEEDVVVGSPVANRARVETEPLIGFFANTLVLRTDLSGDPTFVELLARVREATLGAYGHQDVPFERLVESLGAPRGTGTTPVFQVMMVLQNMEVGALRLGELEIEPVATGAPTAKFDLLLSLAEHGGRLGGTLEYRAELFDAITAERMLERFARVLETAAARPELRLSALPLLGGDERRQVVEGWSATAPAVPAARRTHDLFAAAAARVPDATALVWGAERISYREVDARSLRLARHLRARGVGPDVRVGICLERGPELPISVLAVMRAGGTAVPVDPGYPAARVAYMLEDAAAPVLLTRAARAESLGGGVEVVRVDADAAEIAAHPAEPFDDGALPDHLAYAIYTSGSTGRPKGVALPHRALVNLLAWQAGEEAAAAPTTLQFASASFDVSFQELFSTWGAGGTLVLVDEETRYDPAALLELVDREGVERLFVPAVALEQLAEAAERRPAPARLREVQTAGEQLRVTGAVRRFFAATGAVLGNQYGPSETHVATAELLEGSPDGWPDLPAIGVPIAGARALVVERGGDPAPVGVPGELLLGGDCLARGYLGRPGLTAERFVPDPFGTVPGARLYRTGDRARWTSRGRLEFLGRMDEQVKVRGFRIEPGEIEAALLAHAGVSEAVVTVREQGPGDRRLVGYVVAVPGAPAPGTAELRRWVGERLPDYMIPSAFVTLEALPLTPSGKVDRRALPAPAAGGDESLVPARTDTEERLAAVWRELLGVERVGRHDGFFELGGHSLLLVRLQARIRERLGKEVPVVELLRYSTLAAQAERLDARASDSAGARRRRGSERAALRRALSGGRGRGEPGNPHA